MNSNDLYLEPNQARQRSATTYEDLLGDAIERAFGSGTTDLEGLVESLNASGLASPSGKSWSPEVYRAEIATLGLAS